jgi:hypothetical protein
MNRLCVSAVCLIFAGCAVNDVDESSDAATAALGTSDGAEAVVAAVPQVEIASYEDEQVCRRETTTGSRFITKRCRSREEIERAENAVADHLLRQEVEVMRQQQVRYEQARMARQEALRRAIATGR